MATSRDGYFVHAQNGGRISPTSGRQGITQRVGRGTTTKTGYIGGGSRIIYEEVICRFGTPESVVVDRGAENKKWTDLLLKHYNIWKITITPYDAAADGVIERGHRPIADVVSNLTACSDETKEMWIDHLLAVIWANRITVRRTTGDSPFRLMFGQDAVLPIELENLTGNTAHWIQGIHDTAWLIAARE